MMLFADNPDQGRQGADKSRIVSIPFFPEIDLTDFREVMRVDANISDNRTYHAVLEAVAHVNGQLKAHRLQAVSDGIATLAQTAAPDDIINGGRPAFKPFQTASQRWRKPPPPTTSSTANPCKSTTTAAPPIATPKPCCWKSTPIPSRPEKPRRGAKSSRHRRKTTAARHISPLPPSPGGTVAIRS